MSNLLIYDISGEAVMKIANHGGLEGQDQGLQIAIASFTGTTNTHTHTSQHVTHDFTFVICIGIHFSKNFYCFNWAGLDICLRWAFL
jgi:hypothetical protein